MNVIKEEYKFVNDKKEDEQMSELIQQTSNLNLRKFHTNNAENDFKELNSYFQLEDLR